MQQLLLAAGVPAPFVVKWRKFFLPCLLTTNNKKSFTMVRSCILRESMEQIFLSLHLSRFLSKILNLKGKFQKMMRVSESKTLNLITMFLFSVLASDEHPARLRFFTQNSAPSSDQHSSFYNSDVNSLSRWIYTSGPLSQHSYVLTKISASRCNV